MDEEHEAFEAALEDMGLNDAIVFILADEYYNL